MTFRENDIVIIDSEPSPHYKWKGLKCQVLPNQKNDLPSYVRLLPLEDRPDGHGRTTFLWSARNLRYAY